MLRHWIWRKPKLSRHECPSPVYASAPWREPIQPRRPDAASIAFRGRTVAAGASCNIAEVGRTIAGWITIFSKAHRAFRIVLPARPAPSRSGLRTGTMRRAASNACYLSIPIAAGQVNARYAAVTIDDIPPSVPIIGPHLYAGSIRQVFLTGVDGGGGGAAVALAAAGFFGRFLIRLCSSFQSRALKGTGDLSAQCPPARRG